MKIIKKSVKVFGLLVIIGLAGLFVWRPYLIRVLWYQTPDQQTYKIFPQEFMAPAATPFNFIRPATQRNDLDTLHVLNGADSLVTLTEYIKAGKINAFLVIRNDSVLYERYQNGYTDSTLTTTFSMAKSMIAIAIGKAVDEGKIKISTEISTVIPELKRIAAYKGITIADLLNMRSGLEFKGTEGSFIDALLSDEAKYFYTNDMRRHLLQIKQVNTPNTVWKYKSPDAILLGWILENATGKTVTQYFGENIWKKIGAAYKGSWGKDWEGLTNTASRFQATAIDIAKIGKLFLQQGQFNGEQVLSKKWVASSTVVEKGPGSELKGWQQSAHHLMWWIPQTGINGDYAAEGMLGQRLYIDPLTHTIIVQFADKGAGHYPYRKISRYLKGIAFSYTDKHNSQNLEQYSQQP